jgi:hypothetical protein
MQTFNPDLLRHMDSRRELRKRAAKRRTARPMDGGHDPVPIIRVT